MAYKNGILLAGWSAREFTDDIGRVFDGFELLDEVIRDAAVTALVEGDASTDPAEFHRLGRLWIRRLELGVCCRMP